MSIQKTAVRCTDCPEMHIETYTHTHTLKMSPVLLGFLVRAADLQLSIDLRSAKKCKRLGLSVKKEKQEKVKWKMDALKKRRAEI